VDLISSREFAKTVEVSGTAGALLRSSPDEEFGVADGISWGIGTTFPSRSRFRALIEWEGEIIKDDTTRIRDRPYFAEDGSIAPPFSINTDPSNLKLGVVYQAKNGFFGHVGLNYSRGTGDRSVGGNAFTQNSWDWDFRLGWHPGTKVYVPPPPPEPIVREVVREVPAPAPPAPPPPNRNPTFSVGITCDPCVLEPGQTSRLGATATDPDGDPLTYRWTPQAGTLNSQTGQNVVWTAPANPGNVQVCVTASDNRGGSADNCITLQVVRRQVLMFEDVHFDFDKYNLKPEAVQILDAATSTLQMNPTVRITIEGHCDSIGTVEYNLALGERRANVVRDYLVNRGIANGRLRTVSYGEERPKADNNTAEGRAMNRRAALVVIIESQ
jgi:peptidoglycan-associated lipoprotein